MNITFKNNLNIENHKKKFSPESTYRTPLSCTVLQQCENKYEERPLKSNHPSVNFKGLSVSYDHVHREVEQYGHKFGTAAREHLKEAIVKANIPGSGLSINGDSITFTDKSFVQRFFHVLSYPITNLPLNLTNSALTNLQKIPGFKESGLINNLLDTKILKNHRISIENTSNVAAIKNYFEMMSKGGKGIFNAGHGRFSTDVGNYDSTAERTVTRIITGAPFALWFSKSDAHNIAVVINGDEEAAKEEGKRRRRQEIIRVAVTAGATFGVLKLFPKTSNKSAMTIASLITAVTIVSEVVGRLLAGNPVLPLSKKGAKKYAEVRGLLKKHQNDESNKSSKSKSSLNNKNKPIEKTEKKNIKFTTVLEVLGLMVLGGYGIKKFKKIKQVEELLCNFNEKYNGLFTKDFIISRKEFNKITQKLKDNGFERIADKYHEIIKDQKGDLINLGETDNKIAKFFIHDLLTFPVRFVWKILMMPFKACEKVINIVMKKKKPGKPSKDIEMLQKSIEYLKKIDKKPDYKNRVNKTILSSFDCETKSDYSNADAAAMVKNWASTATTSYLLVDTFDEVMINTEGEDKDLAIQKTKERAAQRFFKIMYGAFFVTLYTSAFSNLYNSSLLGAQLVNLCNVFTSDTLERKSVGMPLREATREEILESERKNLSATGFKGAFFRLMAKITGKKSISEQANNNKH